VTTTPDRDQVSPDARIALWAERDAAIGAAAEHEQVRHLLAARDAEIADLRQRVAHSTHTIGELQGERERLVRMVDALRRPPAAERLTEAVKGKLRAAVSRHEHP